MSGEREGDREAMRRTQKAIMSDGIPREQAAKMARESLERVDRRKRESGKR